MKHKSYSEILRYCAGHSSPMDPILHELDRETHLTTIAPQMSAGQHQGVLLETLSCAMRPQRILEVGTFTGYGTICLSRGLGVNGRMDTIEVDPEREMLIRKFLERSELTEKVHLHIGDAFDIIPALESSYDLIYIDAGKQDYAKYFEMCIDILAKPGLMIFDNVLWSGKVLEDLRDPDAQTMHAFNNRLLRDERLMVTMLPMRDGITLIRKR